MSEADEELPEADPRSDVEYDVKLEVEGGTLVWKDPVASGEPVLGAYLWPVLAFLALGAGLYAIFFPL